MVRRHIERHSISPAAVASRDRRGQARVPTAESEVLTSREMGWVYSMRVLEGPCISVLSAAHLRSISDV